MGDAEFFHGGNVGFRYLPFESLAEKVGVHHIVLRYLVALFAGYPLAFVYLLLPKHNPSLKHLYFIACGLFISYFCFGTDFIFILISILISYASFLIFGCGYNNVVFTFIFQMSYMLGAYVVYASDGYDIKWTTPQCMLCLKLIGLAWDCYDGSQKKEKLRPYQLESCYEETPTFLELLGFSYFFGSFLAGPLFSFKTYILFTEDNLMDSHINPSSRYWVAMKRIIAGLVSMYIFVTYDSKFPTDYLISDEFNTTHNFFSKCTIMTLTYHVHFCKYVIIWMFSESICVITGLAYNGVKDGKAKWDGVRNFKYRTCLLGPFFQDMLENFNINTSRWSGKYVFRRLAFLGNKTISHVLTLLFLSVWHGFYVGYLILFAIEFGLIIAERNLCANLRILSGKAYEELSFPSRLVIRVIGCTYRAYVCAFAATAFMLLRWRRIKIVYANVYYWGILSVVLQFVIAHITGVMAKNKVKAAKKAVKEE